MNPQRLEIQKIIVECRALMRQKDYLSAEKKLKDSIPELAHPPNLKNLLGVIYHLQSRFPEAITEFREAAESNPQFIDPILNLTVTLCDLGRYDQAQELYKKAETLLKSTAIADTPLSECGRLANKHADLGDAYCLKSDFYKGISEYKRALAIFHSLPDVRVSLAGAYTSLNEYQLASKELEIVVNEHPDFLKGHLELGILYYRLDKKHLAKNSWVKAANLDPKDSLARAYRKLSEAWTFEQPLKHT